MKSKTHRLDRFISQNADFSMSEVRPLLAQERILVNGEPAQSVQQRVTEFTHVVLDGVCLQKNEPIYLMFNKPVGVVSATQDVKHTTVIDLLEHPRKHELHIVGRLDFNTTGLVLLTNDGQWSRRLSLPESKYEKIYEVTLSKPLTDEYITAFRKGIYFRYEGVTTKPAQLTITSDYSARLSIIEGKYHQIKRMFGFFQNEVLALHRTDVGPYALGDLKPGHCREFRPTPTSDPASLQLPTPDQVS